MSINHAPAGTPTEGISFYENPGVRLETLQIAGGIPLGIERVFNPELGIGGAYGSWGESYDNQALIAWIERRLEEPLLDDEIMNLAPLGFNNRHHIPVLTKDEHLELEVQVGARMLTEAARANGWHLGEVEAVLIGMSGPVSNDYVELIARRAGIPDHALKVSVHKACDGSMGALHLSLNPALVKGANLNLNIAEELRGKKVLVGGIEGLSRFVSKSRDKNALQLFASGAGVIGVIPGVSMKFLVGKDYEVYDQDGVLAVHMYYPHSMKRTPAGSLVELSEAGSKHLRVAGMMHEPDDGSPVAMAGPMGMVKLFVRSGVQVVQEVYNSYRNLMEKLDTPDKSISVTIAHHANFKINLLKSKHLSKIGINLNMPWLLSDFGNVSAASNMIAFLRQLPNIKPGEHVLFDGFGAGTYYDVFTVAMGDEPT